MPPRTRSASLTTDDLAALTDALAAGKRATVYLREGTPSLGLAPGSSARVISIDGTTVLVRPRGIDDELPFEADELRRTKEAPPEPAPKKAAPKATAPRRTVATRTAAPNKAVPNKAVPVSPAPPQPAARAATTPAPSPTVAPTPEPKPARKTASASKAAAAKGAKSVTVTLYGSPDNQWSVAVTRGARKPLRSRPVTPDAVDAAIRELGDDATVDAVTALTTAARLEAQRRVEELSRELAQAQQALAALEG